MQPKHSGQMTKWAIELGEYDVAYWHRTNMKAQAIADFLAEIPDEEKASMQEMMTLSTKAMKPCFIQPRNDLHANPMMYTDEAQSQYGSGAGIILISPNEERVMDAQSIRQSTRH